MKLKTIILLSLPFILNAEECSSIIALSKTTSVKVIRKDGNTQLSIPWGAYDKNGTPIDILRELEKKYTKLLSDNENLQNSLKGSVTAFNNNESPTGGKEYTLTYGRFIRGLDKLAKIDPTKNRKIGSLQEDNFKSHIHWTGGSHMLPNMVHTKAGGVNTGQPSGNTGSVGGVKTRPKNVALLYCIKR